MIPDRFNRHQDGVDALAEGHWLILRRRGVRVDMPVRVWFGPPPDPESPGEVLDRSWRWRVAIGNVELDEEPIRIGGLLISHVTDFWPRCCATPIDEAEYRYRIDRQEWAAEYDPFDPYATPGGRIDAMTATLPFLD